MNKFKISILMTFLLFFLISALLGCAKEKPISKKTVDKEKVLNIYIWEDYLGDTTVEDFEKEFNVKVTLETFNDEEMMLSEIQSYPDKHDLVVASDSLVGQMIESKLLYKINKKNVPNIKNVGSDFVNPFYDPKSEYSVPYMFGTTGFVINTKYIPADTKSWGVLWDERYKGKIGMLNNRSEVIFAALKYLGYSLRTTDKDELAEAESLLIKQKPLLSGYEDTGTTKNKLVDEEIYVAQQYSGDGIESMAANENLLYVIPEEGATKWVDNFVIPNDSKNKENAELFINYILTPKISAKIANYLWYANTNEAAREFTNPEILEDETLYPDENTYKKLEFIILQEEIVNIYNRIWSKLQS